MKIKITNCIIVCLLALAACKKQDISIPPVVTNFNTGNSGTYQVLTANSVYKIPVALTAVSSQDRTVNISVTSPTGAVKGTHYNVNTAIVIPAGKVVDTLVVQGVFAQYQSGRKDTLVFTIQQDGVIAKDMNTVFRLAMRGPCFEGEIADPAAINSLRGTYANTREDWGGSAYGPYTTTISAATQTSATTANITVTNIFDFGWAPITFTLDWTDINNRKITLVQQTNIAAASTAFGAGQAGTIQVGPHTQVGTFSYCNQVLTLRMRIGVTGMGYSPDLYEVVLRK